METIVDRFQEVIECTETNCASAVVLKFEDTETNGISTDCDWTVYTGGSVKDCNRYIKQIEAWMADEDLITKVEEKKEIELASAFVDVDKGFVRFNNPLALGQALLHIYSDVKRYKTELELYDFIEKKVC